MAFLEMCTLSTKLPFGCLMASPSFIKRLHTTGHFLQRGRLLQQRFFGFTTRGGTGHAV
jgi:hypothetical protein